MTDYTSAAAEPDSGLASAALPTPAAESVGSAAARSGATGRNGMTAGIANDADRFRTILTRTIVHMNENVDRVQLVSLAKAAAVIGWEFPDVDWKTWLVVDRDPARIGLKAEATGPASLTVIMDSTVLHAAAAGETSLGMAFITGKLQIRGMNPLFLAKFVKLVEPLLSGYRVALEEVHERAA
jgi:alkyl sulfatase BDS1-like metallo-beta-lactamase superfamily hydrolase